MTPEQEQQLAKLDAARVEAAKAFEAIAPQLDAAQTAVGSRRRRLRGHAAGVAAGFAGAGRGEASRRRQVAGHS